MGDAGELPHWSRKMPDGTLRDWIAASELGGAVTLLRAWSDLLRLVDDAFARFQTWATTGPALGGGLVADDLEPSLKDESLVFRDDHEGLVELRVVVRLGLTVPAAGRVWVGRFEVDTLLDGTPSDIRPVLDLAAMVQVGQALGRCPGGDRVPF
jgi:hypothetical protein